MSTDEISTPGAREALPAPRTVLRRPKKTLAAISRIHAGGLHREWGPMANGLRCGYHIDLDGSEPKICFFNLRVDEVYCPDTTRGIVCEEPDWADFRRCYKEVTTGIKERRKFLSRTSNTGRERWITMTSTFELLSGTKRLIIWEGSISKNGLTYFRLMLKFGVFYEKIKCTGWLKKNYLSLSHQSKRNFKAVPFSFYRS